MCLLGFLLGTGPRGGSRNSRRGGGGGGSKIKFMKGVGLGGDVTPPVAGPGAQPQPLFKVSHLFGMKIKALHSPAAFLSFPFIWHEN